MLKTLFPLLACTAALFLTSCAGLTLKQDLDGEVRELQTMRTDLESSWSDIENRIENIEREVQNFGPSNTQIQSASYYEAVGEHLLAQDTEVIVEAGVQTAAHVDSGAAYEALYEAADSGAREEMDSMRAEGERILSELRSGLTSDLKELTGEASEIAARTAIIREKADKLRPIADKNPLMTSADRDTFDQNDRQIDTEIQNLMNLVDQITQQSAGMTGRINSALSRFEGKLGAGR